MYCGFCNNQSHDPGCRVRTARSRVLLCPVLPIQSLKRLSLLTICGLSASHCYLCACSRLHIPASRFDCASAMMSALALYDWTKASTWANCSSRKRWSCILTSFEKRSRWICIRSITSLKRPSNVVQTVCLSKRRFLRTLCSLHDQVRSAIYTKILIVPLTLPARMQNQDDLAAESNDVFVHETQEFHETS